jgi:hypothetical protein
MEIRPLFSLCWFVATFMAMLGSMAFALQRQTLIFAGEGGDWEGDYMRELFPLEHFHYVNIKNFNASDPSIATPSVVWFRRHGSKGPLIDEAVNAIVLSSKPSILVQVSAERNESGDELYPLVPLVLRQYSIKRYRTRTRPHTNVLQIPLGYMSGFLTVDKTSRVESDSALVALQSLQYTSSMRDYNWAFIGSEHRQYHTERIEALKVFSSWSPHYRGSGLRPRQMRDIYLRSKFVLVGRGASNLDCFRIYEAILAGAIPIVVGSRTELTATFEYNGDMPPLLFAQDYPEALNRTRQMDTSEIDLHRYKAVQW